MKLGSRIVAGSGPCAERRRGRAHRVRPVQPTYRALSGANPLNRETVAGPGPPGWQPEIRWATNSAKRKHRAGDEASSVAREPLRRRRPWASESGARNDEVVERRRKRRSAAGLEGRRLRGAECRAVWRRRRRQGANALSYTSASPHLHAAAVNGNRRPQRGRAGPVWYALRWRFLAWSCVRDERSIGMS
jgi:hypothetical protein